MSSYKSYYLEALGDSGSQPVRTGGLAKQTVDTPNYHEIVAKGGAHPMNPYLRDDVKVETPIGIGQIDSLGNTAAESWAYSLTGGLSASSALGIGSYFNNFDDADAKAVRSFYENARGSDVQGLVTIGEFPKTIGLVASSAKRIASAMRSLKRLDITGAFAAIGLETGRHQRNVIRGANSLRKSGNVSSIERFASGTWLEMQYGWKPLLYEIEGAITLLDQEWAVNDIDILIKGSGSERFGVNSPLPLPGGINLPFSSAKGFAMGEGRARVKYTCGFRVINPVLRNTSSIGLTNLGEVAWEFTPWSFVSDWVFPIGAWISSLTALHGLSFVKGCKSSSIQWDVHASLYETNGFPVSLEASASKQYTRRTIIQAPPSTLIGLRPKDLDEAFNLTKAVTSLALLSSVR